MSWHRPKALAIALVGAISVAVAISWFVGSELIRPATHSVAFPDGFVAQRVSIPGRGHMIAGWWIDDHPVAPVVLLVHGIRSDRSAMVPRAKMLRAHGFSVLLIDLQAHGETPGDAITLGWRESNDVESAVSWLKSRFPARRIGAIGTSLGGAAILLAHQPTGLSAIVLEAVFPRIDHALYNRARARAGLLAPAFSAMLLAQIPLRLHINARALQPVDHIDSVGAPVLVVAGSRDTDTTLDDSQDLYHAANQPKDMWIVQGAGHQDFEAFDAPGYETHVVGFLVDCLHPVQSSESSAGPGDQKGQQ